MNDHERSSCAPTRRQLLGVAAATLPALGLASLPGTAAPARNKVEITAADGHRFSAWRSDPAGAAKGGIVVLHAVFGLTDHMGEVCARWAEAGYTAIAPALFDRLGSNIVHPYNQGGVDAGAKNYAALSDAQILADIRAAALATGPISRTAISGFCTGGSWSWHAAAKMEFAAQVNFYGSHVVSLLDLAPRCPTIIHYGDADAVVPMPDVDKIRSRYPGLEMHIYPGAAHAFENREQRSYDERASQLAWERSIAFMNRQVGNRPG
jgi:carboxymethylenebutenolidase